jgi:hypothetical protein
MALEEQRALVEQRQRGLVEHRQLVEQRQQVLVEQQQWVVPRRLAVLQWPAMSQVVAAGECIPA